MGISRKESTSYNNSMDNGKSRDNSKVTIYGIAPTIVKKLK